MDAEGRRTEMTAAAQTSMIWVGGAWMLVEVGSMKRTAETRSKGTNLALLPNDKHDDKYASKNRVSERAKKVDSFILHCNCS